MWPQLEIFSASMNKLCIYVFKDIVQHISTCNLCNNNLNIFCGVDVAALHVIYLEVCVCVVNCVSAVCVCTFSWVRVSSRLRNLCLQLWSSVWSCSARVARSRAQSSSSRSARMPLTSLCSERFCRHTCTCTQTTQTFTSGDEIKQIRRNERL